MSSPLRFRAGRASRASGMNFHDDAGLAEMVHFLRSDTSGAGHPRGGAGDYGFLVADEIWTSGCLSGPHLSYLLSIKRCRAKSRKRASNATEPSRPTSDAATKRVEDTARKDSSTAKHQSSDDSGQIKPAIHKVCHCVSPSQKGSPRPKRWEGKCVSVFAEHPSILFVFQPRQFDEIVLEQEVERDSAMLQLIVYLPDRSPVKVKLLDDGTVDDAIKLVLQHRESE